MSSINKGSIVEVLDFAADLDHLLAKVFKDKDTKKELGQCPAILILVNYPYVFDKIIVVI